MVSSILKGKEESKLHHVSKKYIDRMIIKLEQNKAKRKKMPLTERWGQSADIALALATCSGTRHNNFLPLSLGIHWEEMQHR